MSDESKTVIPGGFVVPAGKTIEIRDGHPEDFAEGLQCRACSEQGTRPFRQGCFCADLRAAYRAGVEAGKAIGPGAKLRAWAYLARGNLQALDERTARHDDRRGVIRSTLAAYPEEDET